MSDAGFHCFAPDWLGFGFSDKPEKGYDDFDFTGLHHCVDNYCINSATSRASKF